MKYMCVDETGKCEDVYPLFLHMVFQLLLYR